MQRDIRVLQAICWKHAGILRSDSDIARGLQAIADLKRSIAASASGERDGGGGGGFPLLRQAELMNMVAVAELVLSGAKKRKASAGLHFNVDRPALASTAPSPQASRNRRQQQQDRAPVPSP